MICGSGGSKSWLAKAAGAEPCGQVREEKLHTLVARSTFPSQKVQNTPCLDHFWKLWCRKSTRRCGAKHICKSNVQNTPGSEHFWKMWCRKSARRCGAKHISKSKCTKHTMFGALWKLRCRKSAHRCAAKHIPKSKVLKSDRFGALLDVQMWFCVAGARECAPGQKWAKREGFLAFPKAMAVVDIWSGSGKMHVPWQGADFLRAVAFWSIRFSVSGRWFCVTGAALCVTWPHFFVAGAILQRYGLEKMQNAVVRGRQLCIQLPLLKDVSQNCFVFDVANFKNWGSLAELLRFWCCQLQKLRKSCRIVFFDVIKFKSWGSLPEFLRFQALRIDR